MGKKGTKRKTRWRTLSIGEAASEDEGGIKKTNGVDHENGSIRSSNYSGYHGGHQRNGGYPRTNYGHQGTGRTFSSQSTPTRRNGTNGGYYPGHQYARNGERSHSSTGADAPKITFNEDEYTRITTPRQDVLFKKGYLSKRKPLVASTSTSSADPGASTSAPSTPSTQSTSPEHHAHANEVSAENEMVMPDGLVFPNGFYDQNGVFYVNALANFEGYGPMMMYPYGPYPPYGHIEYYNQVCMQHPFSNPASYAESQVSDTPGTTSPHNEAAQSSPEDSGKASTKDTGDSEGAQQSADSSSVSINNTNGQEEQEIVLQNGMVDAPHYIYPGYMFGSQMYHINGINIQCANGMTLGGPMDVSNKQKIKKKRRRKQRKPSGCNGTAATDNSEDEFSSDSEAANDSVERDSSVSSLISNNNMNGVQESWLENQMLIQNENYLLPTSPVPCDPSKSILNTNCSEFIPKAHLLAKTSQLKTDVREFVPQCYKVQQTAVTDSNGPCAEPEQHVAHKKVEVAVQTKEIKEEIKPVVKQPVSPVANGVVHKTDDSPSKQIPQPVTESVRKVQIVCVEKPSPIGSSTPRVDQWTTVKSSRSKNKKGRSETSSASPTSPISDVASENTFRMFIEGNVTPPPSEEDGSLDTDKPEDNNVCFTSDDTVDNNEEQNSEESNLTCKKNNKVTKSKSKKSKKSKDNGKNKNNYNDSFCDDKKNKSRAVNGKPHKMTKQVNLESVKSNLAQLLGPTNITELDFTKIQSSDKMNGIGIEELKELYFELPELKDQRLENLLEDSPCRMDDDYIYTASVLSVTENTQKTISDNIILPPTPEDSLNNISISKENEKTLELSTSDEIPTSNTESEEVLTVASCKITQEEPQIEPEVFPIDSQLTENKSDNLQVNIANNVESSEELESTLNSVPDIFADSEVLESELLDEGVILPEVRDPELNYLYITSTVRRWLTEQKEKSPEPVLREPNDPALAILLSRTELDMSGSSDPDTDDGDDDSDRHPKNLRSNPLRALSVESMSERLKAKRSRSTPPSLRRGETGDTDSDYLSDIQDDARKRVAGITSEPDLLDCWEPDILPFNALPRLVPPKTESAEEVLEQYESVYGKSVDYEKLSASLGANKPVPPPLRGEGVIPPCNGICCSVM